MRKNIAVRLLMVLLAFTIVQFGGCQNMSERKAAKTIKIALLRDNGYSMAYLLLVREKFLSNHIQDDVAVEWFSMPNHANQRDALISGQSDIGYFGMGVMIAARENGAPIVPLSYLSMWDIGLFSASERINSIDDITASEKIVNSSIGDSKHIALMVKLRELYGDARKFDNNMMVMNYADLYASWQTNDDISAAILPFPDTATVVASGVARQIADLRDVADKYTLGNVVATTEDFTKNNPAFIESFHKALNEAITYVNENPREAFDFLSGYMNVEPGLIQSMYIKYGFETRISESGYDRLAAFMYEIGLLDHEPKKFKELPNYATISKID